MMQVSSTVLTKNCLPVHVFTSTEQELEVLFKILKLTNFAKIFTKSRVTILTVSLKNTFPQASK